MTNGYHDFTERLNYADTDTDQFWERIYRKAFPDMISQTAASGDTPSQRLGIDRVIVLSSGIRLIVEEKKRETDYGDILLEYVSNDRRNVPGWIEQNYQIDYLAYAIMPRKTVYLLHWQMLRWAWQKNKELWKKEYKVVRARNVDYFSLSLPIPINVLYRAMNNASKITLDDQP